MPNRILKESINESKALASISPFAQDLFKRLITYADDYGRFNADTEIIRARLYTRELEEVTPDDIQDGLIELAGISKVAYYTSPTRDDVFGYFPNWTDHQRIRNTRAKCPEPTAEVNDWYLRRFVPIELKVKIFLRDKFTCQKCHRDFSLPEMSTKRAIRLLYGAVHIDHIVPVIKGGRVTEENLRLLCASCNLSRQRLFSRDALPQVAADGGRVEQVAADGGNTPQIDSKCNLPQVAADGGLNPIQSNPIQSESNTSRNLTVSEGALKLSELLKSEMLKNNPNCKLPTDLKKWAVHIDHMVKIDKREPEQIKRVIIFSQSDKFWKTNILSTEKLREQYDQLWLKMKTVEDELTRKASSQPQNRYVPVN